MARTVEAQIEAMKQPSRLSDVTLIVGGQKLYLSRHYLAHHSAYFEVLFFGEFGDKDNEEHELQGVPYEKFVVYLSMILPNRKEVTARNLSVVLEMADRFESVQLVEECEQLLLKDGAMSAFEKLRLADRYRLTALEQHVLDTMDDWRMLAGASKFGLHVYSTEMKCRLLDKFRTVDITQ